jgi:hypothetical protein
MSDVSDAPNRATEGRRPRRRWAKGVERPSYLRPGDIDRLMIMMVALMAEVSVLRDRIDTHEALAEAGQPATTEQAEAYQVDDARQAAREERRQALLKRVLRAITHEREAALEAASDEEASDEAA